MKVSLKWLSKYVDISSLTPEELSSIISKAGTEIEEISYFAKGTNLVVGEVIECEDIEGTHLHKTLVDIKEEKIQIICGAPNCRKGLKVIVALPGCELPVNGGFTIKKGNIRGYESNGMLCSLVELGVDNKYLTEAQVNGIEELPNDAEIGNKDVLGYLGLDDVIFDFKCLPNRGDTLAMYSLAKEVGACISKKVLPLEEISLNETKTDYTVRSETENCKYFTVRSVKNIKVKESPKWMKQYLESSGVRSINNVVDIGNYVMLLLGQPVHMYDANKLDSKEFVVRDNNLNEFIALDEKEYKLEQGDITINIGDKICCLGGVMGSLSTMVDENTTDLVVEAAIFDGVRIRKTSNRLNLVSESSQRYVRGINNNITEYASRLCAKLLVEYADAKEVSEIVKYDECDHSLKVVRTTVNQINKLLGTEYTLEQVEDVFNRLDFSFTKENDELVVSVPSYRHDITIWHDLAEEVVRIIGFEDFKETVPASTLVGVYTPYQKKRNLIREYLINNGINETMNYTLDSVKYTNDFNIFNNDTPTKVMQPMTEDRAYLRTSLISSLLHTLNYNENRKVKDVNIYEVSRVYTEGHEYERLGIVLSKDYKNTRWMKTPSCDFYTIKGLVEGIFLMLGIDPIRYNIVRVEKDNKYYHPGRSAYIQIGRKTVGVIGQIHPLMEKKYDVNKCFIAELDLKEILNVKSSKIKFEEPCIYPSSSRDIALVCKDEINSGDIIKLIKKNSKGIISSVEVFDIYKGSNLEEGYKSIAISIVYQSKDHTLKDDEIVPVHNNILLALQKELAIELRK